MIEQAKNAAQLLRACGLKRSDYRVRTERIMRGRTFVGYGDARIVILCSRERELEVMEELAKRFHVTKVLWEGTFHTLLVKPASRKYPAGLHEWEMKREAPALQSEPAIS